MSSTFQTALVACTGDWHTFQIAESLKQIGISVNLVTTLPTNSLPVGLREDAIALKPLAAYRKLKRFYPVKVGFYQSITTFWEFDFFDRLVASRILIDRPGICILWSNMAKHSLKIARRLDIPTILVLGNSPLSAFKQYTTESGSSVDGVRPFWIKKQLLELPIASLILVESTHVSKGLERCGVSPEKIAIIGPHVEEVESAPAKTGPLFFGTVQLSTRKGTQRLLSWWNNLSQPAPTLFLIGSCNLAKTFRINTLPSGVKHLGQLSGNNYVDALQRIDVALFPTFEDGGPRSLFECMSYGACPIVSERSAGPDHIINGENGFVIPIEDERAWISRINWCLANPIETRLIGDKARLYTQKHLNKKNYKSKIVSLLRSVFYQNDKY